MSEKNRDNKNRWRNVTIAFRMSPEENAELDLRVKLCGYQTRQEYIIESVLHQKVTAVGNPLMLVQFRKQLRGIEEELKRLTTLEDADEELFTPIRTMLEMVMRENEIEWVQKGTHEPHLSVLDYKKKVREQEVEELTEHKNLLEHDLHDISECVNEIQKEKEQVEKEREIVIQKTEVLEKRFSALNSKAGLVDSHAREYGYYPEEWLPEA